MFAEMDLIRQIYEPSLAFLPIGDHFTMGPTEAAYAARMLKVKRVIPMHYGTFPALTGRPERLAQELNNDGIEVWTFKAGQPERW